MNSHRRLPLRRGNFPKNGVISVPTVIICFGSFIASFYIGIVVGWRQGHYQASRECGGDGAAADGAVLEPKSMLSELRSNTGTSHEGGISFPDSIQTLVRGMARVDRDEFATQFDLGVPLDKTTPGNQEVLLLYSGDKMLPKQYDRKLKQSNDSILKLSAQDATAQCTTMKVVLTEAHKKKQHCFAIMGQWESYHVHKFMRVPQQERIPADVKYPLRYVSRSYEEKGRVSAVPAQKTSDQFRELLVAYYESLDEVLSQLKPIARRVARDNTIVVMVCNLGQSELLMNFACSAKHRGLRLDQILVFATDEATRDLAEGLGMTAFYDSKNYAAMPQQAANRYADQTFSSMMLAKVYCVHMINRLGYDLLFQDVDVVWYREPIEWFHDKSNPLYNFDMYFQDDGAHTMRYAPYSPNTGFYYVRANAVTQNFFDTFLRMGDLIMHNGSHQGALAAILNEFTSWRGLRVKIVSRDMDEFPGGFHYHRRKQYMKDMIEKKVQPYVFHMSWTENKNNKKKYFQQMGDFFVNGQCVGKAAGEIGGNLSTTCCLPESDFVCHYRDKPSVKPCKDSPPIDKDHKSWW